MQPTRLKIWWEEEEEEVEEDEEEEEEEDVTLSQQLLAMLDFLKEELLHCLSILQIRELQEVGDKKN